MSITNLPTVEEQFQLYLEKVDLSEQRIPPNQTKELRRAFFGAWRQSLALIKEELSELDELSAILALEKMYGEVLEFWKTQN